MKSFLGEINRGVGQALNGDYQNTINQACDRAKIVAIALGAISALALTIGIIALSSGSIVGIVAGSIATATAAAIGIIAYDCFKIVSNMHQRGSTMTGMLKTLGGMMIPGSSKLVHESDFKGTFVSLFPSLRDTLLDIFNHEAQEEFQRQVQAFVR